MLLKRNVNGVTDTVTERLKVDRVRRRRLAGICFFVVDAAASSRSFCEFLGVATVKTFSSVNYTKLIALSEYMASNIFDRLSFFSTVLSNLCDF